jgi:hypothetical protein
MPCSHRLILLLLPLAWLAAADAPPVHPVDSVPLAVLAKHIRGAPFSGLEFVELRDGRLRLTVAAKEILGLDAAGVAAVEAVYGSAYGEFRAALAAHPPTVEAPEPGKAVLTFAGMDKVLAPLRSRIDDHFAALVAHQTLSQAQLDLLAALGSRRVDSAFLDFGKHLDTVTLARRAGRPGRPASWSVEVRSENSSSSSSGGSLDQAYRPLLDFVDFADDERLPPINPAAEP